MENKKVRKISFQLFLKAKMSVLQPEPTLSISTNQCKKQFLTSEIAQMKLTKSIYLDILSELKSILKETSSITKRSQISIQSLPQKRIQQSHGPSLQISINSTHPQLNQTKNQYSHIFNHTLKLKQQIQQFTSQLSSKVSHYCCSEISQNIVKYLEIQKEEQHFHPKLIDSLSLFAKNHQKIITQRQKQLQSIQDLKYLNAQSNLNHPKSNPNNKKPLNTNNYSVEKDRQTTEKTISSFDFNRRLLQVAKKQITLLKLKKRKLEIQLEQKNLNNSNQVIQNPKPSKMKTDIKSHDAIHQSTTGATMEETNFKKLPQLKNNSPLKDAFLSNKTNKNDISAFEKIVMVYQKDKFINAMLEQKISNLGKKLQVQKYQNRVFQEKTRQIEKEMEKLEWQKVCDQTFVGVQNKKLDKMMELSILDRTDLLPCDQLSVEYSKMSINQSMIKRY